MKRIIIIAAILISLVTFEGCYSARSGYYYGRPAPVVVGAGFYRPAPVIVQSYGARGYHGRRGWRRGSRY